MILIPMAFFLLFTVSSFNDPKVPAKSSHEIRSTHLPKNGHFAGDRIR